MKTTTLADVRNAQPNWFSRENRSFFGDVNYKLLTSGTKSKYLIRLTNMWSDMFGGAKKYVYTANIIEDDLKIGDFITPKGSNIPMRFETIQEVKDFLKSI